MEVESKRGPGEFHFLIIKFCRFVVVTSCHAVTCDLLLSHQASRPPK